MSLLTKVVSKNLFRRQLYFRAKFEALSTISSSRSNHNNNNNNNQGKSSRFIYPTVIAGVFIVSYSLFKEKLLNFFPANVNAATSVIIPSRRTQFNFIADVVETAAKSLVYIEIQDSGRMDYHTGKPATVSNGSGFIVESDGLILTNAHVVVNKPRSIVSVKLPDGRIFQGTVEAIDPVSDLATIRIQCKKLPVLKLGESKNLRAGEFVIALGSPLCELIIHLKAASLLIHFIFQH